MKLKLKPKALELFLTPFSSCKSIHTAGEPLKVERV